MKIIFRELITYKNKDYFCFRWENDKEYVFANGYSSQAITNEKLIKSKIARVKSSPFSIFFIMIFNSGINLEK